MSIPIFVDELSEDKSMGTTYREDSILRNMVVLNRFNLSLEPKSMELKSSEHTLVFPAGRYVCMRAVDEDDKPMLSFLDFRVNTGIYADFVNDESIDDEYKALLTRVVEYVNAVYEDRFDAVELVVGNPLD